MHGPDEVAHPLEHPGGRFDHEVDALAEHVELAVGDQRGYLDQGVVGEVQTGHLAVDPDQLPTHPRYFTVRRDGPTASAYAGTHFASQPEPSQVSAPRVTEAAARVATTLTALIKNGPSGVA